MIAQDPRKNVIVRSWKLLSGGMWKLKHQTENHLKELIPRFRGSHSFYVIVSENEVKAGDPVSWAEMEVCFQLI